MIGESFFDLPKNWFDANLEDIIINFDSVRIPVKSADRKQMNGNYAYYGASGIIDYVDNYLFDGEYLLIGEDGANLLARSKPIAFQANGKFWVNNHAHVLQTRGHIPLSYLKHYINHIDLKQFITGSAQPKLTQRSMNKITINLPPLNEQKRIVNKIEELFTKLDAGIQELTLAKEKLKIYRQSVLKHAFEGKLTDKWREAHKYEIESNFSSDVQQNDLNSLNFSGLPEIPEEWTWGLLGELGELNRGKSKHRPRNDERLFGGKYPFIQTGEVKNSNGLITSYSKTYSDFGLEQSKLWPKGTLCITIAANIAETALLGIDACFPDSVVGFMPNEEICDINYINYFIKNIKNKIQAYAPATAQKNINLNILRKISVPLPPLCEQNLIVNRVEQTYSISENMEQAIDFSILKTQKLRQSILKKAFNGQLVPQDPNDEPAEKLLERIKAEKEKDKEKSKRKTKKSKSKQKRLI